ncbi:hypothetical protein E2C01_029448 [Portunus trituberculatus]|uniref:Uncharacterized protein n=1 Tax=Portunus trituberculatus TaxID=210409 RepID=A0A5B7ERH0_PORTR|nr:hypothetical protein [Portunus trituberculatus]
MRPSTNRVKQTTPTPRSVPIIAYGRMRLPALVADWRGVTADKFTCNLYTNSDDDYDVPLCRHTRSVSGS